MALTREQAMGMLFAPPWAPGTYDDATIWNDAHRKYPPANVPVGVPVGTRDALTAQLMQQPQNSPFGTGDTIRYPGGLAGGLGGEQPGYPDNPNLDLGQTNPQAPGPFSGITDPSQLGPVIGQPVGQPNNPAVALDPSVSAPPSSRDNTVTVAPGNRGVVSEDIPALTAKDPFDPDIDTNTPVYGWNELTPIDEQAPAAPSRGGVTPPGPPSAPAPAAVATAPAPAAPVAAPAPAPGQMTDAEQASKGAAAFGQAHANAVAAAQAATAAQNPIGPAQAAIAAVPGVLGSIGNTMSNAVSSVPGVVDNAVSAMGNFGLGSLGMDPAGTMSGTQSSDSMGSGAPGSDSMSPGGLGGMMDDSVGYGLGDPGPGYGAVADQAVADAIDSGMASGVGPGIDSVGAIDSPASYGDQGMGYGFGGAPVDSATGFGAQADADAAAAASTGMASGLDAIGGPDDGSEGW